MIPLGPFYMNARVAREARAFVKDKYKDYHDLREDRATPGLREHLEEEELLSLVSHSNTSPCLMESLCLVDADAADSFEQEKAALHSAMALLRAEWSASEGTHDPYEEVLKAERRIAAEDAGGITREEKEFEEWQHSVLRERVRKRQRKVDAYVESLLGYKLPRNPETEKFFQHLDLIWDKFQSDRDRRAGLSFIIKKEEFHGRWRRLYGGEKEPDVPEARKLYRKPTVRPEDGSTPLTRYLKRRKERRG